MHPIYEERLHMNKGILFGPANGMTYTKGEYRQCCTKQPFPLIPSYLWAKDCDILSPPTLNYGFSVDGDKIMKILLEHLPDTVEYLAENPAEEWALNVDFDSLTDEELMKSKEEHRKKTKMVPYKVGTLGSLSLSKAISNHLDVPEGFVCIDLFTEKTGKFTYGVSLGSNYTGLIAPWLRDKVRDFFQVAPDIEPQWYLHPCYWYWSRATSPRD